MKYALILCDGMADYPIKELGNRTPLCVASTPYMDLLAKSGKIGLVKTVPDGYKPGSDVANLGALGYDARKCYTGRSPLEALSIGVDMRDDDLALRTNLVTLSDDEPFENKSMLDYSAGEISTAEAAELMAYIQKNLGGNGYDFHAGVSYRHCLIISKGSPEMQLTPPHDIYGRVIGEYLPKGALSDVLLSFMERSYDLLKNHPINQKRVLNGQKPANSVWFWGQGTKPTLENFEERYHKKGGMVSAVDLLKGIAIGAGMTTVDVEGATGTIHTNFDGKAAAVISLLESGHDFAFVHLEAPDECGHQGDMDGKIKSIEIIDKKIIGAIYEHFKAADEDISLLIMPDHFTPLSIRTHSAEPVPFLMFSSKEALGSNTAFTEETASASGIYYAEPWRLTEDFFRL